MAYHTVFFGGDYPREFQALFGDLRLPESPTVYICSQDAVAGAQRGPEDSGRRFVLVNAPPRALSEGELAAARRSVAATLAGHGLLLDLERPGAVETTPSDYARRFPGSDGAIYGWPTHGWASSFRRHGSGTGIGGLYLAGGTVHPGPGIPMAAISGRLAAARVCRDWGLRRQGEDQAAGSGTT
jgi:1-hydroxycarotenoid 3,4-desaturase